MEELHDENVINRAKVASEDRLMMRMKEFSGKIEKLKKEITELKGKIEIIERNSKNTIFIWMLSRFFLCHT